MKNHSPAVDAYIAKAPPYAQPILKKLRELFHRACPQIEEVLKWGVPSFEYKGIVGGMAAFKHYVRFGFWKGQLLSNPHGLFKGGDGIDMNAQKLTTLADLCVLAVILGPKDGWLAMWLSFYSVSGLIGGGVIGVVFFVFREILQLMWRNISSIPDRAK